MLFESQAPRESRRIDSTVIRVLYLGFVISQLPIAAESSPLQAGLRYLQATTVVHAALAVLLAVRLSGDVAGERASGMVGLLALSGVTAQEVVWSRLLLTIPSFLSVWLVRVPFLVLAFHLGGTTVHQILHIEALLLGLFGMTFCVGLLVAHYSPDRTISRGVFLIPCFLDLLMTIPSIIVSLLHSYTSINVPLSIETAFSHLRYMRTTSCLFYSMRSHAPSPLFLCPLAIHLAIALLSLWAWRRVYYTCLDEAEVPATPEGTPQPVSPSKSMTRPSRPCWDDALAWQAYQVHSDGRRNKNRRSFFIFCCLVVVVVLLLLRDPDWTNVAMGILAITTLTMMFVGRGKTSDCLQKEIKQQTLPALLMTPHSSLELCDGWARGAWKLMQPDLILYGVCVVGALLYSPMELAPIVVGVGILLQASGPFLVLSPLVPFSIQGIATGLGLVASVVVMLAGCVPLSAMVHPWLGPLAAIPLAWGWNQLCRSLIPSWFAQKQDELV